MKTSALGLVSVAAVVVAVRVDFKQIRRPSAVLARRGGSAVTHVHSFAATTADNSDPDDVSLSTVHDLLYLANVTVGGSQYPVQLDTGSSDFWIKNPSSTSLPNVTHSSIQYNLTYGIGWAYGPVSYADVEFAGIHIPKQAFMDVSSASNPALSYGADGILGLGFTSLSTIDALVNQTGTSAGRSFLYNAFAANKSEPNFIAFSLQRSSDASDDIQGSFAIGELEPEYASVANQTALPTWPVNSPTRWNVLLEALIVNQTITPVSSNVTGAPSNRAVSLLDSGTSYTYASEDFCNAIYGNISGAHYDDTLGQWVVPCNVEIDMALQFGGKAYPIHPLDVTPISDGSSTTCVGSFIPQSVSVGAGQFDILIGDNVLRSMYSLYDFGDYDSTGAMGNPYVKLLSLVDANDASKDFASVRGAVARTGISYPTTNSESSQSQAASSGSTSIDLSDQTAKVLATLGQYLPALAGIIALNALLVLALLIMAIWYMCGARRRAAAKTREGIVRPRSAIGRQTPRALSPMPMTGANNYSHALAPPGHVYEPVSMALSEDTVLVPPSPGYKYDPESAKGFGRPHSYAASTSRLSQAAYPPRPGSAHFAQGDQPEDAPFEPPALMHRSESDDRPRSMA